MTPRRILIIRPSALGDVCRSVPVLASLRAAYPEARIDWLVQDSFADAVRHHPMLDGVVAFPRKALGVKGRRGNPLPAVRWMNEHLRTKPRYDLVLDAQGLFRSGLFARWTGAPVRVGYRNAEESAHRFYTHAFRVDRDRHAVDRMLALVAGLGITPLRDMRLYASADEQAWVADQNWGGSRYAVLAPTSRWPGKQWPADRFAELARRLLALGTDRVVIVGGPGEEAQIGPLLAWAEHEPRAINLVGATTIARLMAVIEQASLVVANDSAALHMAVGFDRPLVALFGPTRVELVGPDRRAHDVVQHPRPSDRFAHKDRSVGEPMMARITVEEVAEKCCGALKSPAPAEHDDL